MGNRFFYTKTKVITDLIERLICLNFFIVNTKVLTFLFFPISLFYKQKNQKTHLWGYFWCITTLIIDSNIWIRTDNILYSRQDSRIFSRKCCSNGFVKNYSQPLRHPCLTFQIIKSIYFRCYCQTLFMSNLSQSLFA